LKSLLANPWGLLSLINLWKNKNEIKHGMLLIEELLF